MLPAIAALVGVTLGGFITHLASVSLEKRRQENKKEELWNEKVRESVAAALDWITPLQSGLFLAKTSVTAFLLGTIDSQAFREQYPLNLSTEMETLDLPRAMWAYLPEGDHHNALQAIAGLTALYYGIDIYSGKGPQGLREAQNELSRIDKLIQSLDDDLNQALRETYT